MNDAARQALCGLIATYGRSLVEDPRRCEALVGDFCAAHKREMSVLVTAFQEGVATDLLASSTGTPWPMLLSRLIKRLHDNRAVSEEAARWGVETWALALGVVSSQAVGVISKLELEQREDRAVESKPIPPQPKPGADSVPYAEPKGRFWSRVRALLAIAVGALIAIWWVNQSRQQAGQEGQQTEQARLDAEKKQQEVKDAKRRREDEERRLAELKEEQELIETKRQEEEQKLTLAEEYRRLGEQKLREAEQRHKEAEAKRKAQEQAEAERKAQREAAERRRQEERRLASIIGSELLDNFNRSQIQQILEYERTGTSRKWNNIFTDNIVLVTITKTYGHFD